MALEFPQYDPKVAAGLEGVAGTFGGLIGFLGIRHTEVGPGLLRAEVDVRDELKTPFGNLHGGVLAALCDHVLGTVMYPVIARGAWAATTEFKINYLAPVTTGVLTATARIVSLTKRTGGRADRRRERRAARQRRAGHRARDAAQGSVRNEHRVHWRRVALAGHVAEQRGHRCEARGAAQELGERKPLRREQVERGAICGRVDAERPDDP